MPLSVVSQAARRSLACRLPHLLISGLGDLLLLHPAAQRRHGLGAPRAVVGVLDILRVGDVLLLLGEDRRRLGQGVLSP